MSCIAGLIGQVTETLVCLGSRAYGVKLNATGIVKNNINDDEFDHNHIAAERAIILNRQLLVKHVTVLSCLTHLYSDQFLYDIKVLWDKNGAPPAAGATIPPLR